MPARSRVLGVPPSTIHSTWAKSGLVFCTCTQACGLIHSTLTTLPRSSTGDLPSNSAAKAWWATAWVTPIEAAARRPAEITAGTMSLRKFIWASPAEDADILASSHGVFAASREDRWVRSSLQRFFPQVTIHQFFDEFDALELLQARVLADVLVEVHAHLPRAGEDRGILDRRLVAHHAGAGGGPALGDLEIAGVEVAGAVEPGGVQHAGDDDDQRVAFPVGDRLAHPAVDRRGAGILELQIAHRARIFVGDQGGAFRLEDLERQGHVVGARHARQVALDLRILVDPVSVVGVARLQGFGRVGDRAPFDDA